MYPTTVMALFCEDIREEKGDVVTLVGILPDNVAVEDPSPGSEGRKSLSKLCIYIRISFDPETEIGTPLLWLIMPDGTRIQMGQIESALGEKSRSESRTRGNILAGVIARITAGGFQPQHGSHKVEVEILGKTYLAAAITFNRPGAIASEPLSEQSPPAAS